MIQARYGWALLLAVMPVAVRADDVRIGFAPPVGRNLDYRLEQDRPVAGQIRRFSADRQLRFDRAADGAYILHVTLQRIDSDAAGDAGEPWRVAMGPLLGIAMDFRVDAQGRITGLDDIDAIWAKIEAGLAAMRTGAVEGSARDRAVANVQALFAGQPVEGRLALLSGEIRPLLLFANGSVDDAAPLALRTVAGSPLGRSVPVEGAVALEKRQGDMLDLIEKLTGQGVDVDVHYRLSRVGGIVAQQRRTLVMGDRRVTETRTVSGLSN